MTALPNSLGADAAFRFLAHATAELTRSLNYDDTSSVVDDDPMVVDVTRRALTQHGYCVLAAASAADALRLAERARIDLLVTDVAMPGSSGPALAQALAAGGGNRHPVPVLDISGYTRR